MSSSTHQHDPNVVDHQGISDFGIEDHNRRKPALDWGLRLLGIVAAVVVWFLLGGQEGLSPDARTVAAIGALMAVWWMTEAIPFIPVLGGVALGIGTDPMVLLIPAALAATCAFMLPVGTPPNAIVFGTGTVTIRQMAKGGFVLNIVGVLLITLMTYLIGGWALGLQF